jgi:hypothetical protein
MLAFMAGPTMHIGHQVAYLQIFIMPYLLRCLFLAACLMDPVLHKMTYNDFIQGSPWQWPLQGRRTHSIPKRLHNKKKLSVRLTKQATIKSRLQTYLFPIAFFCVQSWLLCGRIAEGVAHLSPSEEAPILSPTNFHRSVKRNQPYQDRPI